MKIKAGYGGSSGELLAIYDRKLQCWKTCQISFEWGESMWLGPLPKSGIIVNGKLYLRSNSELPTYEKDGSASVGLPTPAASDAWNTRDSRKRFNRRGTKDFNEKKANNPSCQNLYTALIMLPTPTTSQDYKPIRKLTPSEEAGSHGKSLPGALGDLFLPIPTVSDLTKNNTLTPSIQKRQSSIYKSIQKHYKAEITGKRQYIHPHFVEWMMGFPIGWTD